MNVIRHQVSFLDPALLPSRQIVKHLTQIPFYLAEEQLLAMMMLAAARQHEECEELEDLFIFGPTPRPDANWGFGIVGKENKVSEARVWSLVHDRPTLKAWLSRGGAYDLATFRKLAGQPNWTMEWNINDQLAKTAFAGGLALSCSVLATR
jgi:hypothetical protein